MAKNEYRKLADYAEELGLEDGGHTGTGHRLFRNPATGEHTAMSLHIDSRGRAIENARAELRRVAGVTNRGAGHVEGERRQRRRKGRLGSGFNLEKAVEENINVPRRYMGPDRDALTAQREAAYLELLSMDGPSPRATQLAARVVQLDTALEELP